MEKINIFIVDDHQLVREGFSLLIKQISNNLQVMAELGSGQEAIDLLRKSILKPDVLLLDINMPGMNGVECAQLVHDEFPEIKIIGLTMLNQKVHIKRMLKAGAVGYLLKDCDREELKNAILEVYRGNSYFSPDVTKELMQQFMPSQKEVNLPAEVLTKRELEVLQLIVQDLSNRQIAEVLNISVRTVESHKQHLLSKTGVNSVAGLVVYAIKKDMVGVLN